MPPRILAFDPGASGGIAELYPNGTVSAFAMMDDSDLRDHVEAFIAAARMDEVRVVVFMEIVGGFIKVDGENVGVGPGMFKFGDGNGYIRGLIDAARIERRMVLPKVWQTGIPGVRGVKEKAVRKRALKAPAARLFPTIKVTLKTADALCIADYGRRLLAQPVPALLEQPTLL